MRATKKPRKSHEKTTKNAQTLFFQADEGREKATEKPRRLKCGSSVSGRLGGKGPSRPTLPLREALSLSSLQLLSPLREVGLLGAAYQPQRLALAQARWTC